MFRFVLPAAAASSFKMSFARRNLVGGEMPFARRKAPPIYESQTAQASRGNYTKLQIRLVEFRRRQPPANQLPGFLRGRTVHHNSTIPSSPRPVWQVQKWTLPCALPLEVCRYVGCTRLYVRPRCIIPPATKPEHGEDRFLRSSRTLRFVP